MTSKSNRGGGITIGTKPRSFSLTMRRVKKAAQLLVMFKKKRPEDMSPILISSPLRERFGKRMSIKIHPDEGFYSLPNRHFSMQDVSTLSHGQPAQTITRKFGTISETSSSFVKSAFRRHRSSGFRLTDFSDLPRGVILSSTPTPVVEKDVILATQHDTFKFGDLVTHMMRILLFVPWCAAVGGALLLFPNHVELVAFRTGYLPSPKGLRRFAHWANCAYPHVMIFLACIVLVLWYDRVLGLSLTCALVSRFVYVWNCFRVDRDIPLGEDDQQSLYLVVMDLASVPDTVAASGTNGQFHQE
ncbi:hypothetical protein PAXRUDRAFT_615895 [Paxillus rubicundulus Ve08.2h10]|uniref:Uncharacterized protein n=1 Tax=Paxillus rubicundulus Ve08.2h10 TaxID=930991 RepID=A0A0D0DKK5_9AGAM|nr:hypothetical protein PAXRUDRAFT_615895 [Paxillus rubicundulus Ve08.2h10]